MDAAYVLSCAERQNLVDVASTNNRDLRDAFSEARLKVNQTLIKVRSHNEKALLSGFMNAKDYLGNLLADVGAGVAAEI